MTYTFSARASQRAVWSALFFGLCLLGGGLLSAQDDAAPKRKVARGRLPAFYAQVVAPEQKEQIYAVQKEYLPRIKELRAQLVALQSERDAKCRALLTLEQQKKVDELMAAAKAAREAADATTKAPAAAPALSVPAKNPLAKPGGND